MITQAPNKIVLGGLKTVFLAGSIEMGAAENWQARLGHEFSRYFGLHVLDPRRPDWDASWEQSASNPKFLIQVVWEQLGLKVADYVIFNFLPETKSPITLLELGQVLGWRGDKAKHSVVVLCPPGYWRKGNVDIVCASAGVKVVENEDHLIDVLLALSVVEEVEPMTDENIDITDLPIVDGRCLCPKCQSRAGATYDVSGRCLNCGARFIVRCLKGDKTPLSVECPNCEVNCYGWR